jgi:hypothetical protein
MESLDAESLCDAVPQKKKRARRQSETEKLSAKGNMHPQELYRRASSHVHMVDEVVFPEPRSRPAPGLWQILAASATRLPMSALALGDFCTGGMMGSFHLLRL